jgi:hypothetical protein
LQTTWLHKQWNWRWGHRGEPTPLKGVHGPLKCFFRLIARQMDGVDQLNNILIIGMTNRIDMIDEALLRPGRLEVHMEISLPDEGGRVQILKIHTAKMRTNGIMAPDVDILELAALTKNFSGAEISGLVKSATSFAFNRHVKASSTFTKPKNDVTHTSQVGTVAGISNDVENLRVNRSDFLNALDEVHPAFGVAEEELQQVVQNKIIHFDTSVKVCFPLSAFTSSVLWTREETTRRWRLTGRAGSLLGTNTSGQRSFVWTTRLWQNCIGCNNCTSV